MDLPHALALAGAGARELLGRLVSPPRCAACDTDVGPRAVFCGACLWTVERAPLARDASRLAAFQYGGAIAQAITLFKYSRRPDLARALGDLLWLGVEPHAAAHARSLVVPVPLHASRLAERGYNQSALLAIRVARLLGTRCLPLALARTRDTPRQAALGRGERLTNVAGAFVAREARVRGARVLVVDDVATTGATLRACEAALLAAGAASVASLVLARAA